MTQELILLLSKPTMLQNSSANTVKEQISGFSSYKNPNFGIEIQYPNDWIFT
jgi:hypothetical protein